MTMQRDWLKDCQYNWFIGQAVNQYFIEFYLWEVFFDQNPIKHLIELGTWHGGFSTYLATQCFARDIEFDTFDIVPEPDCFKRPFQRILGLHKSFHRGNIFEENFYLVKNIIETSSKPFALFCDNGNKPLEFKTFVPFLKPGDFVIVHDWGHEFFPKDIVYSNIEEIMTDRSEDIQSMTRFMRIT